MGPIVTSRYVWKVHLCNISLVHKLQGAVRSHRPDVCKLSRKCNMLQELPKLPGLLKSDCAAGTRLGLHVPSILGMFTFILQELPKDTPIERPWIAEMYAIALGAAQLGIHHHTYRNVVMHPPAAGTALNQDGMQSLL